MATKQLGNPKCAPGKSCAATTSEGIREDKKSAGSLAKGARQEQRLGNKLSRESARESASFAKKYTKAYDAAEKANPEKGYKYLDSTAMANIYGRKK
jgi:hypothetical protein